MMMTIANCLGAILFGVVYAFWRRCYGGLDSKIWKKLFPKHGSSMHRQFWRIVNIALLFCLSHFYLGLAIAWSVYVALIIQFVFWDWTFGMYMGIGRHAVPPPASDIEEYNEQVFAKALNWLIEGDQSRYGEFYDYLGMMLRFAAPGLLMFFVPTFSISFCLLGMLIATSYLVGIRFAEKGYDNFFTRNFSELAAGFFTGTFIAFI